jgi:hypothetical protein
MPIVQEHADAVGLPRPGTHAEFVALLPDALEPWPELETYTRRLFARQRALNADK